MTNISERLKNLRIENGLSQEKLAEKLLVSRQAVSKWENGEALPDMENMIALARLYNTSLDELVGIKDEKKTADSEKGGEESFSAEDPKVNVSIKKEGNTTHVNFEGINIKVEDDEDGDDDFDDDFDRDDDDTGRTININALKGKVTINDDGIDIGGKIKIDDNGINIKDGKVKIDSSGIIIDDDAKEKSGFIKFLYAFPYPIVATIAFLLLGALADAWWIAWILFCTIPVYYSIVTCIHKRRFSPLAYPVLATCIYLFIGMAYSFWHPGWVIFLTIPVYHVVASQIDKAIANRKNKEK